MHFKPSARLDTSQVQDRRYSPNLQYFLKNARQEPPLRASALRSHDYLVYFGLKYGQKKLEGLRSPQGPVNRGGGKVFPQNPFGR
jgi:hypothetical protein